MGRAKAVRKAAMAVKAAKRAGTEVVQPKAPIPVKIVGKQAKTNQANRAANQAQRATSRNASQQRAIDVNAAKQRARAADGATPTGRIPKGTRRQNNTDPKGSTPTPRAAVSPPPTPSKSSPGFFAQHGKKVAAGVAVGALGVGAMSSRTGKAVDSQTGLPRGIYGY
jgi:hypothetical protein